MTMDNHKRIGNATFPCINLIATSTATANTLRNRLRSLAISFEPNAQKPELQALCSLHQLGVIQTGCTADQKLVHQVRLWWEMDLKARSKELERLDLDDTGKRLDNIKSLILKLQAIETEKMISMGTLDPLLDESDEGTSEDLEATSDEESEEDESEEEDSAIEYDEDDSSEELYEDTDESSSDSSGEDEDEDEDFDLELWLDTEELDY
ncbi:hypothetical protein EYC84_008770 [Monilinia fructicola]|uniref:Uncharacterized protein n=1 Tax=Monilinia fructicola TaxID=38448 RepID=A0A5M9J964_MONFR|nr:hypothetical protein EYC84_008770 [Monilinia fructicola]